MSTAICTISSYNYIYKANVLFHSLLGKTDAHFINLITDSPLTPSNNASGVRLRGIDSLTVPYSKHITDKYRGDSLRWGCKPLLIAQLLSEGYKRVIYVDNDVFFYSSPDFIFDLLDKHAVLLTPHHYPANPDCGQEWLEANFRVGLYNAGFIAASVHGKDALEWWAGCCAYAVRKSAWRGLFDDQKYLDLFPVLFGNVHILKHKGCNVAGWNIQACPRETDIHGNVVIDGEWPLVFVHFNTFTFRMVYLGKDPKIAVLAQRYIHLLRDEKPGLTLRHMGRYTSADIPDFLRHMLWKLHRILIG